MDEKLKNIMLEAARLTRSGRIAEATALVRRSMEGGPGQSGEVSDILEGRFEIIDEGTNPADGDEDGSTWVPGLSSGTFRGAAGTRDYKLYLPRHLAGDHPALLVMLHGCGQTPDTFAAVTGMNALAEEMGFIVLYPAQAVSVNASRCWSWYSPENQRRGMGEPAIIAEMTGHAMRLCGADAGRIFVAGFSAGGALAATLAALYPDLFAAVGVHSGLPHGAASDMVSAMLVMAQGMGDGSSRTSSQSTPLPVIVFHGDSDTTVNPSNGEAVIAQLAAPRSGLGKTYSGEHSVEWSEGRAKLGLEYTRWCHLSPDGHPEAELWMIHGGGHAWFGGSPGDPFSDPRGPNASREMLRFFVSTSKLSAGADSMRSGEDP